MAHQSEYHQIASDPKIKGKKEAVIKFEYTDEELTEKEYTDKIIAAKERYREDRRSKEVEWTESYKMYNSWIDTTRNPFLSNLFIPKVHEAVELLSAWLIGSNQSISADAENSGDHYKAVASGKWLDFLWRKVIKARLKVLTWIKQGIVFGNGIIKIGWDADKNRPFLATTSIEDVYFDYFVADIQESEFIIHEVRRSLPSVQADESFDEEVRNSAIVGSTVGYPNADVSYKFSSYDGSLTHTAAEDKVPLLEAHNTHEHTICTLIPTSQGWRKAKLVTEKENVHFFSGQEKKDKIYYAPFVKLRFKTSPLSNRAYDTGAVYPTVKIQRSFNDLVNQYFDNVVMINNPMWFRRRGSRINPAELQRRAGGVISMSNINEDLRAESVADVKPSIIEMINRLDNEFQQASMVVNLLKGVGGDAQFATEIALGQQNVQTLLDMIDENINDALSEVGNMLLSLSIQNFEGNQQLKMFESDAAIGTLDFKPNDLKGLYDVKISADRSAGTSKVVRQKQMLDFIGIVSGNEAIQQRYPNIIRKSLEVWLEEAGISDTEYLFDESQNVKTDAPPPQQSQQPQGGQPRPANGQLLSETTNLQSAGGLPAGRA